MRIPALAARRGLETLAAAVPGCQAAASQAPLAALKIIQPAAARRGSSRHQQGPVTLHQHVGAVQATRSHHYTTISAYLRNTFKQLYSLINIFVTIFLNIFHTPKYD